MSSAVGPLPGSSSRQRAAWWIAVAAWLGLIVLTLAWELLLAPLRPGGSWLALKVVPLLLPLPALLRGSAYAMQIALFVAMLYVFEGAARVFEPLPATVLAAAELALSAAFLGAAIAYLRPMKLAAQRRPK
ncbi:MAG TPA: DUF2069 domain-containing protein [Burkholderiaceae bacterium]|nr:DUF2069 domain-containing protein [Burkholderiaceae bacterium]